MGMAMEEEVTAEIVKIAKTAGFVYVTMDLQGFRSGSMNEALSSSETDAFR